MFEYFLVATRYLLVVGKGREMQEEGSVVHSCLSGKKSFSSPLCRDPASSFKENWNFLLLDLLLHPLGQARAKTTFVPEFARGREGNYDRAGWITGLLKTPDLLRLTNRTHSETHHEMETFKWIGSRLALWNKHVLRWLFSLA